MFNSPINCVNTSVITSIDSGLSDGLSCSIEQSIPFNNSSKLDFSIKLIISTFDSASLHKKNSAKIAPKE